MAREQAAGYLLGDPRYGLQGRLWLRTVVAFNNDDIGDGVRLSHLDIRLVLG
jgi:hypothetical protein